MPAIVSIRDVSKTYASGFHALSHIDLDIERGEILALLGPNGAGKTTLINIVCGIVTPTSGDVTVNGHDIVNDYRSARALIGLVPQELTTDAFTSAWSTAAFSRGLFGKAPDPAHIEKTLKALALWDKKDHHIRTLSGGMKRRVMIAKALSHEPQILFLDEPTAGVDVELRREMWQLVRALRETGVTVILTTHYIEEAEEMADRIGIINRGELVIVEGKEALMHKLGRKEVTLQLAERLGHVPEALGPFAPALSADGLSLTYGYDSRAAAGDAGEGEGRGVVDFLRRAVEAGLPFNDLRTKESSLEEIFVSLVAEARR